MSGGSVEDHLAIERLIFQYAMAIDDLNPAAFAECFASNAVLSGPSGNLPGVTADIVARLWERLPYERTMHNVHNHMYTIQDRVATGMTYCVASHIQNKAGERYKLDQYIRYHDELIKQNGRWLFLKRRYEPIFTTEVPVQNVITERSKK